MVRRDYLGTFGVNSTLGTGRLALIAAALLALALGGCGRKSGLDLPPQASVQPAPGQPAQAEPQRRNPLGLFDPTEEDRPVAAQGQKRRIILDNILD
jgi:predicted small lipoprotein YifL